MNKLIYNLLKEPSNQDYYDLLDYAAVECRYMLLVIRNNIQLSTQGQETLNNLANFLYLEKQTNEWPGTKLLNGQARVYTYHYVPEVLEKLKTTVPTLFQWLQPNLPEDLCLLRKDETPWLVTITHEHDGYFILTEQEQNDLFNFLPRYRFMIRETP